MKQNGIQSIHFPGWSREENLTREFDGENNVKETIRSIDYTKDLEALRARVRYIDTAWQYSIELAPLKKGGTPVQVKTATGRIGFSGNSLKVESAIKMAESVLEDCLELIEAPIEAEGAEA